MTATPTPAAVQSTAARQRFSAPRVEHRLSMALAAIVLLLLGGVALGAGVFLTRSPLPNEPTPLVHSVQTAFVFIWGGFGALVAAFELFLAATWRPHPMS